MPKVRPLEMACMYSIIVTRLSDNGEEISRNFRGIGVWATKNFVHLFKLPLFRAFTTGTGD
jgi:hypothetical protein